MMPRACSVYAFFVCFCCVFLSRSHVSIAFQPMSDQLTLSWEPDVAILIQKKLGEKISTSKEPPFMVAVAGIPGSGKTCSSKILSGLLSSTYDVCNVVLPMDGYHYPLDVLRKMMNMNPTLDDMIYRRGAPDTFDISALVQDLRQIRAISSTPTTHAGKSNVAIEDEFLDKVYIPGFDHSKGDPTPNEHAFIRSKHQVVIMEGLYLLLDESDVADHDNKDNDIVRWKEVSSQFDLKIFIDADLNSCIERLKIRNKCIPGYTPEEIDIRCDIVDRSNALTVMKSKSHADIIVKSYN